MIPSRYLLVSDPAHPWTEEFAAELYVRTPRDKWPEGMARSGVWEREAPEVREALRARARRFMRGDMSVAGWWG